MKLLYEILRTILLVWFILLAIFLFNIFKEEEIMVLVYVSLIVKGKKTFAQVPAPIKEQVKQTLIDLDCEHLVTE